MRALPSRPRDRGTTLLPGARSAATAVLSVSLVLAGGLGAAFADEPGGSVPSQADVAAAEDEAADKKRDVAAVRADLVQASISLDEAGISAAQAAEAYNGAVWQAQEARKAARAAQDAARDADQELSERRALYAQAVVADYEGGAQIQGLSAMVSADGIESLIDRTVTMDNTSAALDSQYDAFHAATTIAEVAVTRASDALDRAEEAEQAAVAARDQAAAAEAAAGSRAAEIAETRKALIAELAELQGISVSLAAERQSALEQAAAQAAAEAAAAQAERDRLAAEQAAEEARKEREKEERERKEREREATSTPTPTPTPTPSSTPSSTPSPTASPTSTTSPTPTPTSTPTPAPTTPTPTTPPPTSPPPPPASGDAAAAIAFARSQIGKPYKYGASGPGSWDCSGLTSAAWAAGGKSLPHYSVAQYTQSTAISSGDLQPGDLVFWGSSSKASSIYHVALYVGDGMIVHAPRTGRNVSEESMYAWRAPDFFARP